MTWHGVAIPTLVPGSDAWREHMSASKVAAMIGLSPWESPFSLWHSMAGLLPPKEQTAQMSRGHYLEQGVREWFADQHPELHVSHVGGCWAHPEDPRFTASPDGIASDAADQRLSTARIVEIKTARDADEWGPSGTDLIPPYYAAQVQWQLYVTGASVCHVAVLTAFLEFREYRIEANTDDHLFLAERAAAFLDSLPGGPAEQRPDLDDHGATYEVVRALHPGINGEDVELPDEVALRYLTAYRAEKEATAEARAAKAALLDVLGDGRRALHNGKPIARRQPSVRGGVSLNYCHKETA